MTRGASLRLRYPRDPHPPTLLLRLAIHPPRPTDIHPRDSDTGRHPLGINHHRPDTSRHRLDIRGRRRFPTG
ncbi:hypothetical protein OKHIF_17680 [Mycobacteroides chelonae]|jgi:hypothetical protein